jgi:hypothetical protein
MDRARPRLTALSAVLCALSMVTACTTTTGSPIATSTVPSTTTADPPTVGYPLPKGRRVEVGKGQTGNLTLAVGDILLAHRPTAGTKPGGSVLVLAEVTDTQLIYQAVAVGKGTLATDDPPPAPTCQTTPCPPGRAAPPVVNVDVTR